MVKKRFKIEKTQSGGINSVFVSLRLVSRCCEFTFSAY